MGKSMMIICFTILFFCTLQVICQDDVNATLLHSAVPKGAVCLDGTPPAYAYTEGFGDGSTNWIIFLEGGAWCRIEGGEGLENCQNRSKSYFGSTDEKYFKGGYNFTGILDLDSQLNPNFYNWHKVFVHYCDGSMFMSDIDQVDSTNNLTFRGGRIYNAIMEKMLNKGMGNAQSAILSGSSAGGLSTILHCDRFRALFSNITRVKCISDSGFFIRGEGEFGNQSEWDFAQVIATHELGALLPRSCTSKRNPNLCLFAEYLVEDVATPLFLVESAFDSFQIKHTLKLTMPGLDWDCLSNLTQCNATEIGILKDFGHIFKETLMKLDNSPSRGVFVDSCYVHTHIMGRYWKCSPLLNSKTIGEAVGDWFYDRSTYQEIDTLNIYPQSCFCPFYK